MFSWIHLIREKNVAIEFIDPRHNDGVIDLPGLQLRYGNQAKLAPGYVDLWKHCPTLAKGLTPDPNRGTFKVHIGTASQDIVMRHPTSGVHFPSITPTEDPKIMGELFYNMSLCLEHLDAAVDRTRIIPEERLELYARNIARMAGLPHDQVMRCVLEHLAFNQATFPSYQERCDARAQGKVVRPPFLSHIDGPNCRGSSTNSLLCASRVTLLRGTGEASVFRRRNFQASFRVAVLQALIRHHIAGTWLPQLLHDIARDTRKDRRDRIHPEYLLAVMSKLEPGKPHGLEANMDKGLFYQLFAWWIRRMDQKFNMTQARMVELAACSLLISGADVFHEVMEFMYEMKELPRIPLPCAFVNIALRNLGRTSVFSDAAMKRGVPSAVQPKFVGFWMFVLPVLMHVTELANSGELR